MKDKLEKTGHRKHYYRFLRSLRGAGFSILALAAFATPVFVALGVNATEATAGTAVQVTSEAPEDSSSAPAE